MPDQTLAISHGYVPWGDSACAGCGVHEWDVTYPTETCPGSSESPVD